MSSKVVVGVSVQAPGWHGNLIEQSLAAFFALESLDIAAAFVKQSSRFFAEVALPQQNSP
ncbi:MAG: hypothetical protein AAB575_05660 [Patescibacteria group bacterium]